MRDFYVCASGHRSSVARYPDGKGVRKCYFCPEVAYGRDMPQVYVPRMPIYSHYGETVARGRAHRSTTTNSQEG